jgi:hypothetical protein
MQDQVNATAGPNRVPWSRRCDPSTSGRSGRNFRLKAALATLPCQSGNRQQASRL